MSRSRCHPRRYSGRPDLILRPRPQRLDVGDLAWRVRQTHKPPRREDVVVLDTHAEIPILDGRVPRTFDEPTIPIRIGESVEDVVTDIDTGLDREYVARLVAVRSDVTEVGGVVDIESDAVEKPVIDVEVPLRTRPAGVRLRARAQPRGWVEGGVDRFDEAESLEAGPKHYIRCLSR